MMKKSMWKLNGFVNTEVSKSQAKKTKGKDSDDDLTSSDESQQNCKCHQCFNARKHQCISIDFVDTEQPATTNSLESDASDVEFSSSEESHIEKTLQHRVEKGAIHHQIKHDSRNTQWTLESPSMEDVPNVVKACK
eukprot:12600848-Ditylum_brightwellii.AAC.1